MSICGPIDPGSLRRLAASMPRQGDDYADLFIERTDELTLVLEPSGRSTPTLGVSSGAAARLLTAEGAMHASAGGLDEDALAALARTVRGGPPGPGAGRAGAGVAQEPAPTPARRSPEKVRPEAGRSRADLQAIDRYLGELREKALSAGASRLRARAVLRDRAIVVATSEGEVREDRQSWVSVAAWLSGDGFGGASGGASAAGVVSAGGGAESIDRLRALHPPGSLAIELTAALEERRRAAPASAGPTTLVLGPGPGGILFHEACGHALEGDRALKGRSALVEKLGEMVGPADLTLVDDPTVPGLPGSRRVDDEGWPSSRNVLIDSGRLVGLLLDRGTARLAGTSPTGSARRESYRDPPLPRMSNTYVVEGSRPPDEVIGSVSRGIYVAGLESGVVDTATADFSFRVTRGALIVGGRIIAPLAPFEVAGNGIAALRGITLIGSDLRFDAGAGGCGKEGQRARAAVGQPTLRIEGLSVRPLDTV